MTKKLRGSQSTMFDALAKKTTGKPNTEEKDQSGGKVEPALEPQLEQTSVSREAVLEPQRRSRAKTGKRSDPAYTQVGCYLPRDLNNRVKVKLVGDSRDFSDLAAELLEKWLSEYLAK